VKSIRRFLVIALVAVIVLANFAAALRGYLGSMREAETLFNQRLMQQMDLLNFALPTLTTSAAPLSTPFILPKRDARQSFSLEFQLLANDGRVLARSEAMPEQSIAPLISGFTSANFHGYRWHILVDRATDQESWFILAERDDQRYRVAESMILKAVYPMVTAIPVIALIVWLVVGLGLRPIRLLARELRNREATDLRPVGGQEMPEELLPLTESANELLRRLEASFEREKRFSGDAAHELRTPIAALKIHCDNLLQELNPPSDSVLKLQTGIERMSYLVEQILMLNRTAPDHFMRKFAPVNLSLVVKNCVAEQSNALAQKNHTIEFDGDDCWVLGDRLGLETLVNNLLGNAIKYTPDGGNLGVYTWLRGKNVVLEVMDDGPGIPAAQYERVFDRFYRAGGDRHDSRTPGCGLGLSIVKQVVDLHGAQIQLTHSRYAHGLLVIVTFLAYQPLAEDLVPANAKMLSAKLKTDEEL
jgi:two-component system, OmpR family, sensor histidine kinase QseC